jgi:hypothetical protein
MGQIHVYGYSVAIIPEIDEIQIIDMPVMAN